MDPNQNSAATPPSAPVASTDVGESDKDYLVTFILNLFLGWLGVDRFYTGHIVYGVIKLVTLGGFSLLIWADIVLLLIGKYKDKQGKVLKGYDKHRSTAAIIFALFLILLFALNILNSR